ncbi:MAG: hypothetical protein ABI024_15755 [Vicinamibacterales bacterium]
MLRANLSHRLTIKGDLDRLSDSICHVTITASAMTPLDITIEVGQRVTFVNNDVRAHDVVGGVDPANPECPEILQAGSCRRASVETPAC